MIKFVFKSAYREFFFLVVLPFIVWVTLWWGFISGKLALGSDAFYYYWDSRFFLDNISHGVYPLWNPDYSGGVPWNFFLRRMGEVNPFYWVINVLKFLGVSSLQAHLVFLVFYYFLGLVGYWLLAKLFLKDRLTSTGAYLLLLFAWGGQLFCCFSALLLVPLTWFFYFLFAFGAEKKKHQFLGVCFAASLMVTTYIPFFTLTIIAVFLFFLFLFFMKESLDFLKAVLLFFRAHKFFAVLSLGFFLLACFPTVNFYFESQRGGFVMPSRHLGSTDKSEVAVAIANSSGTGDINVARTVWDIIAYGYFDRVFSDQKDMGVGDFNIAYLFFIVLILAVINPFSRRTALLLVSGVFLTLTTMTKGRLYPFLLDHVFFFRFMRMLQLFFWLAVLPMAVLMVMEQLRVFLRDHQGRRDPRVLAFVITVHVLFFVGLLTQEGVVWSSYLAVGLSLVFFILAIVGRCDKHLLALILWLGLMVQPIEIVGHICQNSVAFNRFYIIDRSSFYEKNFLLQDRTSVKLTPDEGVKRENTIHISSAGYYENPWLNNILQSIYERNVQRFVVNQLLFFDNTVPEDKFLNEGFYIKLARMWGSLQNLVFLPLKGSTPEDFRSLAPSILKAQVVYKGSPEVRVLSFDVNTLRLQTCLDRTRFLLWTNGYHPGWHVYIDGLEGRLLRADYAFKGVWVPAGVHTVVFRFGMLQRYAVGYTLLFLFVVMMVTIVVFGLKEGFLVQEEVEDGY